MSEKSKEPLAFVTGVDDKCVFIWSSEYPLEELRFPVKLGAQRPQLGQKVHYVCTKSPQEVQYGGILRKVENPSPIIIQRDGEILVETYVAFPSPGSNYCLRELALAEDYHIRFYCHSVEMGTVVSFRDWDYNWQKVYQVHLKRFPKHCDWMIPRVSTMWRICNMQEVPDSAKTTQISSQMPWNNSFLDDDSGMVPMQLSVLDANQSDRDVNKIPPNFLAQSTSQIPISTEPLIRIEEENKIEEGFPQIKQTISHVTTSNNPLQFHELGAYVAKILSKTPKNRIGDAIHLKGQIFSMCTSKQIDLLRGNF